MSVEAVLTVITVVLAVLALIPQERGQDLRIRLGGSPLFVAGIAGVLVVYWALLDPLHSLPGLRHLPRPVPWMTNWTPASLSLLVLLIAIGFAWWTYRRQVPVFRVPRLAAAITDALARQRFVECLHLLEAHFDAMRCALDGKYWQARARTRLLPTAAERHLQALDQQRHQRGSNVPPAATGEADGTPIANKSSAGDLLLSFRAAPEPHAIARALASWAEGPREAAHNIVRAISLAPGLVNEIAAVNPYLGLRLLGLNSTWLLREFADTFTRALLGDPQSSFYRELRRAENIDTNNVPLVDQRDQPLLAALCTDAVQPRGPQLIYTFLDSGIEPLRLRRPSVLNEVLNSPTADYHERGRWTSPPFASIYLLAIVAPRNAVTPHAPQLNLYVLQTLVDAVLRQLIPTVEVDLLQEWPTPSHYLLYEVVSLLVDLVGIWKVRPEALEPVIEAQGKRSPPLTLPEHAVDVLGSVMHACLRSDRLDGRFKGYLMGVWWRVYWDKYQGGWAHSSNVLDALARGGQLGSGDMAHREGVEEALEHIDIMDRIGEGADALRGRFGVLPK